jgi:hypothetical protein
VCEDNSWSWRSWSWWEQPGAWDEGWRSSSWGQGWEEERRGGWREEDDEEEEDEDAPLPAATGAEGAAAATGAAGATAATGAAEDPPPAKRVRDMVKAFERKEGGAGVWEEPREEIGPPAVPPKTMASPRSYYKDRASK